MKFIGFCIVLGGTFALAQAAGASTGWATGIAWAAAIVAAIIARRLTLYRAYARHVMQSPEYLENQRNADEFFGVDRSKSESVMERYRPEAQALDRHVYDNILSIAFAPDATVEGNALARTDPDGFVAVYLSECVRSGMSVQDISDHFDELRAFADENADAIAGQAARNREAPPEEKIKPVAPFDPWPWEEASVPTKESQVVVTVGDGFPASLDEWHALEQACFDEGLLARAFGGLPAITKKGRELVKVYAIRDEDVDEALQSALALRLRDRRGAFVNLVEFAVLRRDGRA